MAKPTHSVSVRKSGFSPKEMEDIINSKAEELDLCDTDINKKIVQRIVKSFQIHETTSGKLDGRRISTSLIRDLGLLPASRDGTIQGPTAQATKENLKKWATNSKANQQKLFQLLFDNGMLDNERYSCAEGGILRKNNKKCSCVEFCNELDSLATAFKDKEPSTSEWSHMIKVRQLCELITFYRIFTASAFRDDILKKKGYKKWSKHLWMIASFAAVTAGLDIYLKRIKKSHDIEDMINSKAEALKLCDTDINKKIVQDVVQSFQVNETARGELDKGRKSTKNIQDLGILSDLPNGNLQGPSTLENKDVKKLDKNLKKEQQKLFQFLLDAGMLNKDEYSSRDGYLEFSMELCSSVDLCNVLHKLAISFKEKQPSNPHERADIEKMRKLCELITYQRICATSKYPDDFLEEKGSEKWSSHLCVIASFAVVIIGMDICLNQTRTQSVSE